MDFYEVVNLARKREIKRVLGNAKRVVLFRERMAQGVPNGTAAKKLHDGAAAAVQRAFRCRCRRAAFRKLKHVRNNRPSVLLVHMARGVALALPDSRAAVRRMCRRSSRQSAATPRTSSARSAGPRATCWTTR